MDIDINEDLTFTNEDLNQNVPSHEDLVNVGFEPEEATEILETCPNDAQRLYDVMAKTNEAEQMIRDVLTTCGAEIPTFTGDEVEDHADVSDTENATCDCRSECTYITGYSHKYANFGYSS